ncbi:hypothetical protein FRB93_011670 [Tulasnella sp. JGI-2019a]|nr:hypothetical protein FRB93_011670 [Tulasnella sp. JGI-2019a]
MYMLGSSGSLTEKKFKERSNREKYCIKRRPDPRLPGHHRVRRRTSRHDERSLATIKLVNTSSNATTGPTAIAHPVSPPPNATERLIALVELVFTPPDVNEGPLDTTEVVETPLDTTGTVELIDTPSNATEGTTGLVSLYEICTQFVRDWLAFSLGPESNHGSPTTVSLPTYAAGPSIPPLSLSPAFGGVDIDP